MPQHPAINVLTATCPSRTSLARIANKWTVMDQDGVDLLRVEGDRIAEVWLFSSDPAEEDGFWGAA
ncbi:hypothetical protein [Amycolatopsis sp. NPDC051128]|uniref:hypothetical protein n=1 Tax=Amycolatopsis sp. NPDC051128 TaxID=3155412 RepID=UPI003438E2BA